MDEGIDSYAHRRFTEVERHTTLTLVVTTAEAPAGTYHACMTMVESG